MRELRLNAFDMNCVVHQSAGLWAHPRDRAATYTDLDYWTNLVRILEAGKFDAIFLADVLGVYDVYGGNNNAALARETQIPLNDPALIIPAMANVTQDLGFGLTLFSGWTGIDFSQYALDDPIKFIRSEAVHSAVEAFTVADPDGVWTVREVAEYVGIGGIGPILVGSPQTVADELVAWVQATDLDGFNLAYAVTPETFSDIVELLIPERQRRGLFKREYRPGTLREKFFGKGPRLGTKHPAHAYRTWAKVPA